MKQFSILLLATFFFLRNDATAQDSIPKRTTQVAVSTPSDIGSTIVMSNPESVRLGLEAYRQKIDEINRLMPYMQNHLALLTEYAATLRAADFTDFDKITTALKKSIGDGKKTEIAQYERELVNFFNEKLPYYPYLSELEGMPNMYSGRKSNMIRTKFLHFSIFDDIMSLSESRGFFNSLENFNQFIKEVNSKTIEALRTSLESLVATDITTLNNKIKAFEAELVKCRTEMADVSEKSTKQKVEINGLAIMLGLPLFCATILLLFLGPSLIRLFRKDVPSATNEEASKNTLVEISTVLLLTMSILILGLSEKIKSDVLGTLIGGISGYVLNRIKSTESTAKTPIPPQPTPSEPTA